MMLPVRKLSGNSYKLKHSCLPCFGIRVPLIEQELARQILGMPALQIWGLLSKRRWLP